jgi:hypothetical protein
MGTLIRTGELISQADPDQLKLLLVCGGGRSVVGQEGRQARLADGRHESPHHARLEVPQC